MRIMVDTNILVSAAFFPDGRAALALSLAMREHTLIVCDYVLEELQSVFVRKFPYKTESLGEFLSKLTYEPCDTPGVNRNTPDMRDEDDRPILQAAIEADADAILTGDKDFHALKFDIVHPKIISPSDFLQGTVFMPRV